jgi:hypothetical protein
LIQAYEVIPYAKLGQMLYLYRKKQPLGPLLFIVFIDDILTDINSTITLFADDTSLYLIVDDPQETAQTLNDDLVKLHAWSKKWLVNFNPQKTETMTISRKLNKPNQQFYSRINIGQYVIYENNEQKRP